MNYFNLNKGRGKIAETAVKEHLEARGHTIIDVSEDKEYQVKDIDFILDDGNQKTTLEVKLDNSFSSTQNIFIEDYSIKDGVCRRGWLQYCEAQYICFYDTRNREGIIVDFPKICSLLDEYAQQKIFNDYQVNKIRYCLLLPIRIARLNKAIVYEWEDKKE